MLQQVELASTFFNKFFQLATTKYFCVTMFGVGGNTCNKPFQHATQHVAYQVFAIRAFYKLPSVKANIILNTSICSRINFAVDN